MNNWATSGNKGSDRRTTERRLGICLWVGLCTAFIATLGWAAEERPIVRDGLVEGNGFGDKGFTGTNKGGLQNTPEGGTVPGGTVPGGTLPEKTLPGGTVPGGTVPGGRLPGGTVPGGTVPGGTLPSGTVPGGTVSSDNLPGEDP